MLRKDVSMQECVQKTVASLFVTEIKKEKLQKLTKLKIDQSTKKTCSD